MARWYASCSGKSSRHGAHTCSLMLDPLCNEMSRLQPRMRQRSKSTMHASNYTSLRPSSIFVCFCRLGGGGLEAMTAEALSLTAARSLLTLRPTVAGGAFPASVLLLLGGLVRATWLTGFAALFPEAKEKLVSSSLLPEAEQEDNHSFDTT